jgi:xanthine dehydrogenase accessory factor
MAQQLLPQKKSLQHHFILHKNAADDIGMVCGGEADMHFQYVDSSLAQWHTLSAAVLRMLQNKQNGWLVLHTDGAVPDVFDAFGQSVTGTAAALHSPCGFDPTRFAIPLPVHAHVYLFGGGHCAQALVPLLASVDFFVTVVENREEYARKELFPQAEQVIYTDYAQAARTLALSPADYVVVMTSGHTHDFVIQEQLLRRPLAYIGVIGSRSKKAAFARLRHLRRDLAARSLTHWAFHQSRHACRNSGEHCRGNDTRARLAPRSDAAHSAHLPHARITTHAIKGNSPLRLVRASCLLYFTSSLCAHRFRPSRLLLCIDHPNG